MSRRPDPGRIYETQRVGTLTRLIGESELPGPDQRHTHLKWYGGWHGPKFSEPARMARTGSFVLGTSGPPGGIRTPDLLIRSQSL